MSELERRRDNVSTDSVFTDEERGDTLSRPTRIVSRVLMIAVVVVGLGSVLLAGSGVSLPALSALVTSASNSDSSTESSGDAALASGTTADLAVALKAVDDPAASVAVTTDTAIATPEPGSDAEDDYIAQALLVQSEDRTLAAIARLGAIAAPSTGFPTMVLPVRATAYTLDELIAAGAVARISGTVLELRQRIVVERGAVLDITAPGQTLHMLSDSTGFTSIVAWGGTLTLAGRAAAPLEITSWDASLKAADTEFDDGRAYIRVKDGLLTSNYVSFTSLGFWSGRTGGVSVTGTADVSATATIANSTMTNLHIGLYLSAVNDASVSLTTITDSVAQGINLGNEATGVTIANTTVDGSGAAGVTAQTATTDLTLDTVTISNSRGFGLRFDGAARAEGPNTAGYSVLNSSGLRLLDTVVRDNKGGGVNIFATNSVDVRDTTIDQSSIALSISGGSDSVKIAGSTISSTARNGLDIVDGPTNVTVSGNTISGKETGILVRAAEADVTDNTVSVTTGYGVLLEGDTLSGTVTGNTLSGTGPDAVGSTNTVDAVTIADNDESDWRARSALILWADRHPLAWLWAALLVVPAVGVLFIVRRYRQQDAIRKLVESTTIALALADKAEYDARRGEPGSALEEAPEAAPAAAPTTALATPARATASRHPATWRSDEPAHTVSPERAAERAAALAAGPPSSPRASTAPVSAPEPPRRPESRASRTVASAASASGQFSSIEQLAINAVIDAGRPIDTVARTLRVSPSAVAAWVARAKADREAQQ